jgi:hypothetical protein
MRWLFIDPTNRAEMEFRAGMLARIDAWWNAFSAQAAQIDAVFSRTAEWDVPAWMHEHLSPIDERLMWEFGPALKQKGHRLVITPEAEHALRPIVHTLVERAPAIAGWEFYEYRLPERPETALRAVTGRTGEDVAGTLFRARLGRGRRVDLTFSIPFCRDEDDRAAMHAAFVACECLLGEQTLDERVGTISVVPPRERRLARMMEKIAAEGNAPWLPLAQLRETVDYLVAGLNDKLPLQPYGESIEENRWATIELKPQPRDDYARRSDLLVAITGALDTWQAAHGGGEFYSACHSRCGETFCYVKIDGREGLSVDSPFTDRREIEDALHAALRSQQLGCVIGGGTGFAYSYIDLALTDVQAGIGVVRETLQHGRVPRRCWILFFDATLAREWVGVYDDSPEPLLG